MEGNRPITIREQQQLEWADQEYINKLELSFHSVDKGEIPPYLGLSPNGWSSYYVGATWLKEGHRPLVVLPKFDNIDFLSILTEALIDDVDPQYFEESYYIDFDSPKIQENSLNTVLSPLIIAHFLSVILRLLKSGLKRNYIIREENLKSKVRGHILPLKNLQKNIIRGHAEQTLCRFQEYSLDYPENQILKRALLASESMLLSMKSSNNAMLQIVREALLSFEGISSDITLCAVKNIRRDKLHGEYPFAINLAKQILRRTDFAISESSIHKQYVPVFAVDMSRIFEFHVLCLLRKKYKDTKVLFQEYAGIMGRCDYLIPEEHLIVDAKYKADYPNRNVDQVIRPDIREVSGYGRSERILKKIGVANNEQPCCLIIYPNGKYLKNDYLSNLPILQQAIKMNGITNFYLLGVSLPSTL